MRGRFAEVPGCDWAIQVTQAARVQIDEHADDLQVVRDGFLDWVSPGRMVFADGIALTVVAGSYDEAVRFQRAASETIENRDLFLIVALVRRQGEGGRWEEIEEPAPASDAEIEADLLAGRGHDFDGDD